MATLTPVAGNRTKVTPVAGRKRRRVRARLLVARGLMLIPVVWTLGDLAYVRIGAEDDRAAPADVILVLGCSIYGGRDGGPSPCIAARADHAAALYRQGLAPHVIASGGEVDETRTEASALAHEMEAQGVPAAAISLEDQSHDTIQNILNSQQIMRAHGWHTVDLVTEPYHIRRATLVALDAGLTVYPSPALNSYTWQTPNLRQRMLVEDAFSLMLYQVKAVLGIHS